MAESKKQGSFSPEILKLTEKLDKDPKSKLFVPLAEEYIKSGMLDEAAMILQNGLKAHPHFSTARVTLGKVYLEKGQTQEAKAEFEQVIATSPDNLLAHRKLARIYKEERRWKEAILSCQAILSVSPKDVEMKGLLDEMARLSGQAEASKQATPVPEKPPSGLTPAVTGPSVPEETEETTLTTQVVGIPKSLLPKHSQPAGPIKAGPRSLPVDAEPPVSSPDDPAAVGSKMAEEIATESLADLYVKQGYYDKGIEIYRRLLEKDPGNTFLKRKHDETEVLIDILNKTRSAAPSLGNQESTPPVRHPTGPVGAPSVHEVHTDRSQDEKIKKLEAWLESIRRGRAR